MAADMKLSVVQLLQGNVTAWEDGYYQALFQTTVPEKLHGARRMRYEYKDRRLLYAYAHDKCVPPDTPIDFLEFGVFQGQSMRAWLDINKHPDSRFFGFDSFEGLPEDWENGGRKKGDFTCDGKTPDIDDPRVSFHKGWFNQSLPVFLETFKPKNKIVVHMDADLFTSSLYVLMQIDRFLPRGTLVAFDDFGPKDDFAALQTYSRCCGRSWHVVAFRDDVGKIAVVLR